MTRESSVTTLTQNDADECDRVLDELIQQSHILAQKVEDDCNEFDKLRKEIHALYHQYQLTL